MVKGLTYATQSKIVVNSKNYGKLKHMIFGKKRHVDTKSADLDTKINYLLNRGVEQILPSIDFLRSKLKSGERLKIYTGVDPTGENLHIGHATWLEKLRQFQDLGHEVVLLIGGFTATIGDPTGKDSTRKVLTEKEVSKNALKYKKQASKFLNFSGKNAVKVVNNADWLKKMDLGDVLNLSSLVTVDQMLKRDMFEQRVQNNKPIYLHEFMYPLMQGYDSVVLNVDVEVGGNDQLFNMLMGRDLLKKLKSKDKFVITMKLLTDPTGKKMGKSEGNMVTFEDSPDQMYGKVMSWTDGMIPSAFDLCTKVGEDELIKIKNELADPDKNPRDLKMRLAREIVAIYYDGKSAKESEENFKKTFQKHETPENIQTVSVTFGELLSKVLLDQKIVDSTGEFKRLVKEGAVMINEEEKVQSFSMPVDRDISVKVGKKRFLKIIVSK